MARKTKEEAAKTREAILESALDLFNEKGYSGTTLNHVAQRLNMTKGAVYWHFKNKQDLFETLIDEVEVRFEKELMPVVMNIQKVEDLKTYFLEYASTILNNPRVRKFLSVLSLKIEWTTEFSDILKRVEEMSGEVEEFCTHVLERAKKSGNIRDDIDSSFTASALTMMVDGIIFESLTPDGDSSETMKILKTALDIFFRGLI